MNRIDPAIEALAIKEKSMIACEEWATNISGRDS
jgi:hypothetical protein